MASAAATVAEAVQPALRAVNKAVQGQNIFVYTHLATKQTIYSLTRSLWNKKALKQMPFAGKKTVPSHLRKDLWQPLCVLSFPSHSQGLDAYKKMREFKMLHETAWDPETMVAKETKGTGQQLNAKKRQRAQAILDQKANAVADMAAVLFMQKEAPSEEGLQKAQWLHERPVVKVHSGAIKPAPHRPKYGKGKRPTLGKFEWQGNLEGVKIHWTNVLDAEYASTWPEDVLHDRLEVNRFTAVWPPRDPAEIASTQIVEMPEDEYLANEGTEGETRNGKKWWQFGKK